MREIKITEEHIKLAKAMYVSWWDCEFGSPAIDCKRPYGNSDVISDILEILGIPYDGENEALKYFACKLHLEMQTALQVFLRTQSFKTGVYEKGAYNQDWKLKQ